MFLPEVSPAAQSAMYDVDRFLALMASPVDWKAASLRGVGTPRVATTVRTHGADVDVRSAETVVSFNSATGEYLESTTETPSPQEFTAIVRVSHGSHSHPSREVCSAPDPIEVAHPSLSVQPVPAVVAEAAPPTCTREKSRWSSAPASADLTRGRRPVNTRRRVDVQSHVDGALRDDAVDRRWNVCGRLDLLLARRTDRDELRELSKLPARTHH